MEKARQQITITEPVYLSGITEGGIRYCEGTGNKRVLCWSGTQLISARLHGKIEIRKPFLNSRNLPMVTFLGVGYKRQSLTALKAVWLYYWQIP